jgi:hypothetical protein
VQPPLEGFTNGRDKFIIFMTTQFLSLSNKKCDTTPRVYRALG